MSAKRAYVFSTLANDQKYVEWIPGGGEIYTQGHAVVIKGGAGVANDRVVTPLGVATEIDEGDIAFLEANQVFQLHKKGGFVVIRAKSADPEKVAADMNRADPSAPKTPSDYVGDGLEAKPIDKD